MLEPRKSVFTRALEALPVFAVIGVGVAGVAVAMNVLVTVTPLAIDRSPSPSPSAALSFPAPPSLPPLASESSFVTAAPSAALPGDRPTFVNSAVSASDPGGVWLVYLGYPGFVTGTTPWADAINADIRGDLATRAAQWEAGPAATRQAAGKVNTLVGKFTTELLTPALASFTLTWVDDSSTGTPATGVETLNYDLSTGQRIAFDDLFTDPSTARDILENQALAQLQVELGAGYEPAVADEGTQPSPANYVNWAITPDGIKITFAEYQVSSRTTLPTIVAPWAALRPVMIRTGPVAALAGV